MRLRQCVFVCKDLESSTEELCDILGIEVAYRDPGVAKWGLANVVCPTGNDFLEIVSPFKDGTSAGRYIERRKGDGGYMVILDSEALPRWRTHVADIGVRIAAPLTLGDYEGMQLHPRDTGGALLEINTTLNGSDLDGPYWPAGPHWTQHVATARVTGFAGARLQSADPAALAQRWGRILQRPAAQAPGTGARWHVPVDNAQLQFDREADGRGEGLAAVLLRPRDADAIRASAQARGLAVADDRVRICGVDFILAAD